MIELEAPADRVLLREHARETEIGGIALPEIAQERSRFATVIAVGTGIPAPMALPGFCCPLGEHRVDYEDAAGSRQALVGLEPGDVVLMPEVGGTEIEWEGHGTVISILASQLLAVVGQ